MIETVLSDEGWPYASAPPVEPGDPGRFHALFGRDSLITSLQLLPARPDIARATLKALAVRQGTRYDADTLEEPGKIGHEFRDAPPESFVAAGWPAEGEFRYYGTADATAWFIVVAARARRAQRSRPGVARRRARRRRRLGASRCGRSRRARPAGLARHDRRGRGRLRGRLRARRRVQPGPAAGRRRHAGRRVRGAAGGLPADRRSGLDAAGGRAADAVVASASGRRSWRWRPGTWSCRAPARSSAGCCGRMRWSRSWRRPARTGCASRTS